MKFNRERTLASAQLEHTVLRQLSEAHSKGLWSDLSKSELPWWDCFNAPWQWWYQGTLAAQLTSRDWWRVLFLVKAEAASLKGRLKANILCKYLRAIVQTVISSLKHSNMGGGGVRVVRWAGGWKDSQFDQSSEPLSTEQGVVIFTGVISVGRSYKGAGVYWNTRKQVLMPTQNT